MSPADRRPRTSNRLRAVLDAGSFKTVCLIALVDPHGRPVRIAGVGLVPSRGIKSGLIVDLAAAENSIRSAIAEAERMAGVRLSEIDVAINGGRLESHIFQVSTPVGSGTVGRDSLDRIAEAGRAYAERGGRRLLHLAELGYLIDGAEATREPLELEASRLAAHVLAVTADQPAISNLSHTLGRCYLTPGRLVPGPLASGLAVTSEDERRAGVIVLDIGAGVTGMAVFQDGHALFTDTVAIGGGHVTLDIVHALRTPLEEAERIKTLYGTVVTAQSDQHDLFIHAVSGEGEGAEQRTTKADLARIIQTRMVGLLQLVRERLANAGLLNSSIARIVICGGASEIPGLQSFAEGIFKRSVREGRPNPVSGLPPVLSSAAFAGAVGVLNAGAESAAQILPTTQKIKGGYFGQVGQWLMDGF